MIIIKKSIKVKTIDSYACFFVADLVSIRPYDMYGGKHNKSIIRLKNGQDICSTEPVEDIYKKVRKIFW